MSQPFIFIGTHTLKPGKLEDFKAQSLALAEVVEAEEPRIIAFNIYASEDGTEVSVVQVHPDADSMMRHMQVVRQHITDAYMETLEGTTSMQVFGPPNDDVLEMMSHLAPPGVPVSVKPTVLAGFTRSGAAS
jgi:hypothetical protein